MHDLTSAFRWYHFTYTLQFVAYFTSTLSQSQQSVCGAILSMSTNALTRRSAIACMCFFTIVEQASEQKDFDPENNFIDFSLF